MQKSRPAPIPVYLVDGGTRLVGQLSAQRAPKEAGGAWVWRLVWRVDGKQKQRGLGRVAEVDVLAAARRVWREQVGPGGEIGTRVRGSVVVSNVNEARDTPPEAPREDRDSRPSRAEPTPDATLRELCRAYLAWHEGRPERNRKKPGTLREYANRCGLLVDAMGGVPIADVGMRAAKIRGATEEHRVYWHIRRKTRRCRPCSTSWPPAPWWTHTETSASGEASRERKVSGWRPEWKTRRPEPTRAPVADYEANAQWVECPPVGTHPSSRPQCSWQAPCSWWTSA